MPADTDLPLTSQPGTPIGRRSRARALLFKPVTVTIKDLVLAIIALLVTLGWQINSPNRRIDQHEIRILSLEKRTNGLEEAQRFTNYMLCVSARRNDPASAPPDCAPIIESRKTK